MEMPDVWSILKMVGQVVAALLGGLVLGYVLSKVNQKVQRGGYDRKVKAAARLGGRRVLLLGGGTILGGMLLMNGIDLPNLTMGLMLGVLFLWPGMSVYEWREMHLAEVLSPQFYEIRVNQTLIVVLVMVGVAVWLYFN